MGMILSMLGGANGELQQAIEESVLHPRALSFVSGLYYGAETALPIGQLSTLALTANRLYAVPFHTGPEGMTAATVLINVTSGSAGNLRLGVYAASTTAPFYPAALLVDWGEVDVTNTGTKTINITDVQLLGTSPSQLVWLAAVTEATPTLISVSNAASQLGASSTAGSMQTAVYVAHTYGVLPTPFGSPTLSNSAPQIVCSAA